MASHGCRLKHGEKCRCFCRRDARLDTETVQVGVLYRHSAASPAGLLHVVAGYEACPHDRNDGGVDGRSVVTERGSGHIRIVHERSDAPAPLLMGW